MMAESIGLPGCLLHQSIKAKLFTTEKITHQKPQQLLLKKTNAGRYDQMRNAPCRRYL